jgi:hypothetical protein
MNFFTSGLKRNNFLFLDIDSYVYHGVTLTRLWVGSHSHLSVTFIPVLRRYDNVVSCSFAEFDIKFIAYYDMQQHIINIKFIGRSDSQHGFFIDKTDMTVSQLASLKEVIP